MIDTNAAKVCAEYKKRFNCHYPIKNIEILFVFSINLFIYLFITHGES